MSPEQPPVPVPASGGGAAVGAAAPSLVLETDAPRVTGSRVFYPETLAEYAKRFGGVASGGPSEKTLKRWVQRGRFSDPEGKVPLVPLDLPPYHNPVALPAWCERRLTNRPPDWVLRVAHAAASSPATPPPSQESPPPPGPDPSSSAAAPSPTPTSAPRDTSDLVALDFQANVHQLRLSLAMDSRLLEEAKRADPLDEALIVKRQRAYRETYDLLRKSEADLIDWQEQTGRLAPRDDIRAENTRIAASIFSAVLRLVGNIRPKLAGKPPSEQDALWREETMRCFISLRDAKFTDPSFLSAA
jgi:hypothetical protein